MILLRAWPVLTLAFAAQAATGRPPVSVDLPPWANGMCLVAGRVAEVRRTENRAVIQVQCGEPVGVVSCDLDGAEPRDAPLSEVCTTRRLAVARSRDVAVLARTTTAARIEWLELKTDGRIETRASRQMNLNDRKPAVVPVAQGRLLRVTPAGASPVTVAADQLRLEKPWTVPIAPGGEVLIGVEQATVMPARFSIGAFDEQQGAVEASRFVAFPSLSPGKYAVRPEYAGGVRGEALPVIVDAGRPTVLVFPAADVGAIRVSANAAACGATPELWVARHRVQGQSVTIKHQGQCDRLIAGLMPGEYSVWLGTAAGSYIYRVAGVMSQSVTDLPLHAVEVTLSGRILVNGRPASDVRIEIVKSSGSVPQSWRVQDGHYSGSLGEPGEYTAWLSPIRSALEIEKRTLTLEEGLNYADWSVRAGVLSVDLRNWDRASRVEVTVRRRGQGAGLVSESFAIQPVDTLPVRLIGLPLDAYRVAAHQIGPRRLLASPVDVLLSEVQPEREVVLDLADAGRRLTLVDEMGQPVAGARVNVPGKEVAPGVFELAAQPGSQILIRAPGFALACRVTPEGRSLHVVLRRGRPLEVHVVGSPNPTTSFVLPDSDCEVPLFVMDRIELPDAGDGIRRFLFSSFPQDASMTMRWTLGGPLVRIDIPASGPLVLRSGR